MESDFSSTPSKSIFVQNQLNQIAHDIEMDAEMELELEMNEPIDIINRNININNNISTGTSTPDIQSIDQINNNDSSSVSNIPQYNQTPLNVVRQHISSTPIAPGLLSLIHSKPNPNPPVAVNNIPISSSPPPNQVEQIHPNHNISLSLSTISVEEEGFASPKIVKKGDKRNIHANEHQISSKKVLSNQSNPSLQKVVPYLLSPQSKINNGLLSPSTLNTNNNVSIFNSSPQTTPSPSRMALLTSLNNSYRHALNQKKDKISQLYQELEEKNQLIQEYQEQIQKNLPQNPLFSNKIEQNEKIAQLQNQIEQLSETIIDLENNLKKQKNASNTNTISKSSLTGNKALKAKQLLQKALGRPFHNFSVEFNQFKQSLSETILNYKNEQQSFSESIVQCLGQLKQEKQNYLYQIAKEQKARQSYLNQLIEMKGNIRVFCRIRPAFHSLTGSSELQIIDENEVGIVYNNNKKTQYFHFDRVFGPNSCQKEVFEDVKHFVYSALDGYNVCIFAYGQTGSGKTYTMEGVEDNMGINYRALELMFKIINEKQVDYSYEVTINVIEIYNDNCRDLLICPDSKSNDNLNSVQIRPSIPIRQGPDGVYLSDITSVKVNSLQDVQSVLYDTAFPNRSTAVTNMNEHSSRSHCLLFVNISSFHHSTHLQTNGKLILIDLAGSERVSRSEAEGCRLAEAKYINKSLSALGDVMNALAAHKSHIPYRNSKLTYLLQDSLGGNSKALMFCQISPDSDDLNESICSLKFAERVKKVELGPAKKSVENPEVLKYRSLYQKLSQSSTRNEDKITSMCQQIKKVEEQLKQKIEENHQLHQTIRGQDKQIQEANETKIKLQQQLITSRYSTRSNTNNTNIVDNSQSVMHSQYIPPSNTNENNTNKINLLSSYHDNINKNQVIKTQKERSSARAHSTVKSSSSNILSSTSISAFTAITPIRQRLRSAVNNNTTNNIKRVPLVSAMTPSKSKNNYAMQNNLQNRLKRNHKDLENQSDTSNSKAKNGIIIVGGYKKDDPVKKKVRFGAVVQREITPQSTHQKLSKRNNTLGMPSRVLRNRPMANTLKKY